MADSIKPSLSSVTSVGMPRSAKIPSGIIESGLISDTSKAEDCFVYQAFSAKLQAFMIGYVSEIYSYYSVYK